MIHDKISIILPSRNEAEGLKKALPRIQEIFSGYDTEIIVSDSGDDESAMISRHHGAQVIRHSENGYGAAYLTAMKHASGDYVLMADPDGSYEFNDWIKMLKLLKEGGDLVIGNRLSEARHRANIPFMNRRIGIPVFNFLINRFFGMQISDSQCGIRAFKRTSFDSTSCRSRGMEFASEMIIKFKKQGLKVHEIPVSYYPRIGRSKLSPIRDGFRHFVLITHQIFT